MRSILRQLLEGEGYDVFTADSAENALDIFSSNDVDVTLTDIRMSGRDGIQLLARTEGIFPETAGGVTVATFRKLVETGQLDPDRETVVLNTGDGLKTLDAVAGRVAPSATIDPSYSAFLSTGLA